MIALGQGRAVRTGPLFAGARGLLLVCLAVIYGGCLQFFVTFSPALLYGTYVVILGCLVVCLFSKWPIIRNIESVIPYLGWILAYIGWASLASSDGSVFSEGIRIFVKNTLLIGALAIALDSDTIRAFSNLVQVAVVANCVLSVWESFDPELVRTIALTRQEDATAFNILRPAGLWSNPDEAAFAIVFALLLSHWAAPRVAFTGRLMGGLGLILTASRTGTYLFVFCAIVIATGQMRRARPVIQLLVSFSILVGLAGTILIISHLPAPDTSEHGEISRILDIHESTRDPDAASRFEIAKAAAFTALEHPWYGSGLFTFQSEGNFRTLLDVPAHNVYLTVWGEAGPFMLATYVAGLGFSMLRSYRALSPSRECTLIMLMWACYLVIGFTWHNQFTSFSGMIYIALLMHLATVARPNSTADFKLGHSEARS